jgi:hypothetical protein
VAVSGMVVGCSPFEYRLFLDTRRRGFKLEAADIFRFWNPHPLQRTQRVGHPAHPVGVAGENDLSCIASLRNIMGHVDNDYGRQPSHEKNSGDDPAR